jgi:hypothetical protein
MNRAVRKPKGFGRSLRGPIYVAAADRHGTPPTLVLRIDPILWNIPRPGLSASFCPATPAADETPIAGGAEWVL